MSPVTAFAMRIESAPAPRRAIATTGLCATPLSRSGRASARRLTS